MSDNATAQTSTPASDRRGTPIIDRNLRAMVEHAAEQERARSTADKIAGAISRFVGSMNFVYFHVLLFGAWALEDRGWLPGLQGHTTSFSNLGTTASVEAIFLATFVLIAQNRMAKQDDLRNHLDLQVSLLTERETTHVLRIVAAISDKMGIDAARNPELRELLREVEPQAMLEKIEEHTGAVETEIRNDAGD